MHARWDSELGQSAPEYVTTSIGRVEISNIANRLRDMAALLAANGLDEAATYLAKACGALLAQGSHANRNGSCNGNGSAHASNGTNGHATKAAEAVNETTAA